MKKRIFFLIVTVLSVLSISAQSRIYNAYGYYHYANSYGYYSFPYHDDVYYVRHSPRHVHVVREPQVVIVEKPTVVERVVERPTVVERVVEKPVYVGSTVNDNVYYEEITPNKAYYADNRNIRVNGFESFDENVATQWTIVFNIGSANITTTALPDLHNIKKFFATYPDCRFEILAYSDRNTGTSARNLHLSKKRGETIANYLNEVKGIPYDRITIDCYGSRQQVYTNNDWNRCVIVRAVF